MAVGMSQERLEFLAGARASELTPGLLIALPQHPDQHRPERSVLLAVDQEPGEGARLRVPPELADPFGTFKVGEHQDVEQLGAGSGAKGVQAFP
jgi:hypothetical protein